MSLTQEKETANRIFDLDLNHIALVTTTPAVSVAVFREPILKSLSWIPDGYSVIEKTTALTNNTTIQKSDPQRKMVWVTPLVPFEKDLQGDIIYPEDIENAKIQFMKNLQKGYVRGINGLSLDHTEFTKDYGTIIDTFTDYQGTFFGEQSIKKAWVLGIQLNDETWKQYEQGIIKGVSIGGVGKRVPVNKSWADEMVLHHLVDIADYIDQYDIDLYNGIRDDLDVIDNLLEVIRSEGLKRQNSVDTT